MSWEGEPYLRWVKMHKGVRYRISCADLARLFPDPAVFTTYTKEGSVKAANAWWLRKRAELDAPPRELRKEFLERYELADLDEKIAAGEAAQRMKFAILTDPYEPLVK